MPGERRAAVRARAAADGDRHQHRAGSDRGSSISRFRRWNTSRTGGAESVSHRPGVVKPRDVHGDPSRREPALLRCLTGRAGAGARPGPPNRGACVPRACSPSQPGPRLRRRCRRPPSPAPRRRRRSPTATRPRCGSWRRAPRAAAASRSRRSTSTRCSETTRWRCAAPGRAATSSRSRRPPPTSPAASRLPPRLPRRRAQAGLHLRASGSRSSRATGAPTTYARVVSEDGRTALEYWFFYIFNDFNNKHEGDWEMIQLDFPAATRRRRWRVAPSAVGYSQHDGAERAAWDAAKLEKVDGTHPVVYPAEGSHANYYEPALYLGASGAAGVGCDNTRGPWRVLRPAVQVVPNDPAAARGPVSVADLHRPLGRGAPAFYDGPTGPNVHSQWDAPIVWAQTRWHRVRVRGAEHPGTASRARRMCSAPEWGRDPTCSPRRCAAGRAVFLAILAVLLLLIWRALRMPRHPSQPLHVARRTRDSARSCLASRTDVSRTSAALPVDRRRSSSRSRSSSPRSRSSCSA